MARLAIACLALSVASCAARGPSPQVVAELGKATALVREKELGLPADASLDRARQHASRRGNPKDGVASTIPPAVLLAAAALVNGETGGLDPVMAAIEKMP